MSAQEIIAQIKALPPEEQAQVVDFVHKLEIGETKTASEVKGIHFATPEQAKAAGDKAVKQYEEVFRKLAQ